MLKWLGLFLILNAQGVQMTIVLLNDQLKLPDDILGAKGLGKSRLHALETIGLCVKKWHERFVKCRQ